MRFLSKILLSFHVQAGIDSVCEIYHHRGSRPVEMKKFGGGRGGGGAGSLSENVGQVG